MLPETMFVMERARRILAASDAKTLADPLENWPSTKLDRAALWFSRCVNDWQGFSSPKSATEGDSAGELRLCKRV
jgi:hypothetical protein